jgi:hypothetical protein
MKIFIAFEDAGINVEANLAKKEKGWVCDAGDLSGDGSGYICGKGFQIWEAVSDFKSKFTRA